MLTIYYFAYGSNMHFARLRRRTPSAHPLETAVLRDHVLRFHKRGRDGSAKCNILHRHGQEVFGVVYQLAAHQQRALDRAEGREYRRCRVEVTGLSSGKRYRALAYQAKSFAHDEDMGPYHWYKRFVVEGARQHGLPRHYIDTLAQVPGRADANGRRHRQNQTIADKSRGSSRIARIVTGITTTRQIRSYKGNALNRR